MGGNMFLIPADEPHHPIAMMPLAHCREAVFTFHRFETRCHLLLKRQEIGTCGTWLGTQHDIAGFG